MGKGVISHGLGYNQPWVRTLSAMGKGVISHGKGTISHGKGGNQL